VRMKTAKIVETVTTGRTMVNVFMDVVLARNCMPNMLWLKNRNRLSERKLFMCETTGTMRNTYGREWEREKEDGEIGQQSDVFALTDGNTGVW
jgi:hypothetical protein